MSRKKSQKSNSSKFIVFILIIAIAVLAGLYVTKFNGNSNNTNAQENQQEEPTPEPKQVQIYSGTDRPIAVMIDNNVNAWPQAGLNDAYIVYEIIVEGGETRLMELFKNVSLEKIGPVRSSRHYYIDYVMENDALYAHYGTSPKAESDMKSLGINHFDGMYLSSTYWRDNTKYAPHNALTSTEKILAAAKNSEYRTTSEQASVLNYTTDEVVLENGQVALDVKIPYSSFNVVEYKYDEETGRYTRYSKGKLQTDWNTGENVTTKNIIITFAENYTIAGDQSGRQDLKNIGSLKGYYITNGKAIEITCNKTSRESKTVYKDLDGNEIKVNDGNTFVQICPINANVTLE